MEFTTDKPNQSDMTHSSRSKPLAINNPNRICSKENTTSLRDQSCKYKCNFRTSQSIPLGTHRSLWLVVLISIIASLAHCEDVFWSRPAPVGATPTPGPEQNFREQPANTSVVEGDIAIMKCKVNRPVHHCRWYYMEADGDFYGAGAQPKLVKQFDPSTGNDCSIRFTKVLKMQEGQWLCQARKYMGTTQYNTRPAFLQVITESDEKEYGERNPLSSDEAGTTRDPTAPTAIPALGPPPSSGPLPFPPRGPLTPYPEGTSPADDLTPPVASPTPDGQVEHETPRFNYSSDDHIQNTKTGATATLPCLVSTSVTSCAWVMPNNALFVWNEADSSVGRSFSINTPVVPGGEAGQDYEFIGDREAGDCSLRVHSIQHHDEGNWRCVVSTRPPRQPPAVHRAFAASEPGPEVDFQGPLIHLHLLDFHHGVHLDDKPKPKSGPNTTLIVLFMVGLLLFAIGAIVIYCCYKRVWSKPEDNSKILQTSPRNSDSEYSQQWFQGRSLKITDPNYTDDFKLRNTQAATAPNDFKVKNVDAMNLKNAAVKYTDIDHYNQYLSMRQPGLASARSSASSNTTLSTMAPDPYAHGRSMGFSASPCMSPASNMTGAMIQSPGFAVMNPGGIPAGPPHEETIPFYELHRQLQRPVSLYSTSHVYEEIEDKIPPHQKGMAQIIGHDGKGIIFQAQPLPNGQIATTPVYTNVVEDHDGYLIPSKAAKIINTPTGEEPIQYLPMKGDGSAENNRETIESQMHPQHNAFIPNMNNLSLNQGPTVHKQILDDPKQAASVLQQRRKSNESTLSDENNYSPDEKRASKENPNLQESTPAKRSPHKSASTTPTSKRQRMPLPAAPTETCAASGPTSQNVGPKETNQPIGTKRLSQDMSSSTKPQNVDSAGNTPGSAVASLHQRTTSLPDTGSQSATHHSKSPSFVPTPENYDVPRSLDAVPRSVNGSEISLDDIDGTIV